MEGELLLRVALAEEYDPSIPKILPHEKVFSIQVGNVLFRLSGASLSFDGPSYFTSYFQNKDKTLFIDRNPKIFNKIYSHLQGYVVKVENEFEFVHLWSDSYYFGLQKLQRQLQTQDLFVSVGLRSFVIPRLLIEGEGNNHNYFTVAIDALFAGDFGQLSQKKMLRPPPRKPIESPNRSPELFNCILELLAGNHSVIRNDQHRELLLQECRFYRFLQLEQRILKHRIISNPRRPQEKEILMNFADLQYRGLSNPSSSTKEEVHLKYARPYIGETKKNLLLQLDSNPGDNSSFTSIAKLVFDRDEKLVSLSLSNRLASKFIRVFKDFQDYFNVDQLEGEGTKVSAFSTFIDCKATINGRVMGANWLADLLGGENLLDRPSVEKLKDALQASKKRKTERTPVIELIITKSLWRPYAKGRLIRLQCEAFEAVTDIGAHLKNSLTYLGE